MRKKVDLIEKPSLKIHMDYDHITVGELGYILMKLQAALRCLAGLTPHAYNTKYAKAQPRFVTSHIQTKNSIDLSVITAILSAPSILYNWQRFSKDIFKVFKTAILALRRGKIKDQANRNAYKGLRIEVTRGNINLEASLPYLRTLTPAQKKALANFIWSLTGVCHKVDIGDDEEEISIEWPEDER